MVDRVAPIAAIWSDDGLDEMLDLRRWRGASSEDDQVQGRWSVNSRVPEESVKIPGAHNDLVPNAAVGDDGVACRENLSDSVREAKFW
jgi:hypothetical protein